MGTEHRFGDGRQGSDELDWVTPANELGIPRSEARELYVEAVREAGHDGMRRAAELYLDRLRDSAQEAPAPGRGSGARRRSTVPGRRALAESLEPLPLPLPEGLRARMEQAFGQSFADVRVIDSPEVAAGQKAVTRGRDIFVEPGAFELDGEQGSEVLAHELAHVAQRAAPRSAPASTPGVASLEADARRAARDALAGRAAPVHLRAPAALALGFSGGAAEDGAGESGEGERGEGEAAPPEVRAALALRQAMRGERIELPHRERIEAHLGRAFDRVRCFTGPAARAACEQVGARAFAVRDVIVFAEAEPAFEVALHEAVHVVQQGGLDAPLAEVPERIDIAAAGDETEREAHRVGGPDAEPEGAAGADRSPDIAVHGRPRLNAWLEGCGGGSSSSSGGKGSSSTAKKTVTLNFTHMHGSTGDSAGAITYANTKVYNQANIEIVKGTEITVNKADTEADLGSDLELDEYPSPSSPTAEERKLFKRNQSAGAVTVYFVKSLSAGSLGEAFWPGLGHGFVGVAVGNIGTANTVSHELGHVLLDAGEHNVPDDTHLMHATATAPTKLTEAEKTKMRSSPYAK